MAGNNSKGSIPEETKEKSPKNNGLEFALGAVGAVFF